MNVVRITSPLVRPPEPGDTLDITWNDEPRTAFVMSAGWRGPDVIEVVMFHARPGDPSRIVESVGLVVVGTVP